MGPERTGVSLLTHTSHQPCWPGSLPALLHSRALDAGPALGPTLWSQQGMGSGSPEWAAGLRNADTPDF